MNREIDPRDCQHGLADTTDSETARKRGNPRFPYVVVESPGTEFEKIVYSASRFEIARNWMERHYTDDFCPADVMKRDRAGNLTTEF